MRQVNFLTRLVSLTLISCGDASNPPHGDSITAGPNTLTSMNGVNTASTSPGDALTATGDGQVTATADNTNGQGGTADTNLTSVTSGEDTTVAHGTSGGVQGTTSTGAETGTGGEECRIGDLQECYSAAPETQGKGICKPGQSVCIARQTWGTCEGEVTPGVEDCGTIMDEDCDGEYLDADEGCICTPDTKEDCFPPEVAWKLGKGICKAGQSSCTEGVSWGPCIGAIVPNTEDCDSLADENCDGTSMCGKRAVDIAAGGEHTCAILDTGGIRCWGFGVEGRLGYGNEKTVGLYTKPASAGDVPVGPSPAMQASAGWHHTCALLAQGKVKCWGLGFHGRLGYGNISTIGDDETPSTVGAIDLGGPANAISSGYYHNCALLEGGDVVCWGMGVRGRLGYGNENNIGDDEVPASAGPVPLGAPALKISAGGEFTCAILESHDVKCWGGNEQGQLGYGNKLHIGDDELPSSVGVVPLGGKAVDVIASDRHACAIMKDRSLKCWGFGVHGELGYGNTNSLLSPSMDAVQLDGLVLEVAMGWANTCARTSTGSVFCFGFGDRGVLGYGNEENVGDDEFPLDAGPLQLGGFAVRISGTREHTCALMEDGVLRCWGNGSSGALGYGLGPSNVGNDEFPSSMNPVEVVAP